MPLEFWTRRAWFGSCLGGAGLLLWHTQMAESNSAESLSLSSDEKDNPGPVSIVPFSDSGQRMGVATTPKIVKTYGEWKKLLNWQEYAVTRRKGTEAAFSGAYYNLHDKGLYRCVCCTNALFSSETKFDSGTGWPSFWAPIAPQNIWTKNDFSLGIPRTEVACRKCDAHLGHVFDDGPEPTHLRYCMNSAALRFAALVYTKKEPSFH